MPEVNEANRVKAHTEVTTFLKAQPINPTLTIYLEKTPPHRNLLVTTEIFNKVIREGLTKTIF